MKLDGGRRALGFVADVAVARHAFVAIARRVFHFAVLRGRC